MTPHNPFDPEPDIAGLTPEDYMASLPKRIIDVANTHQVVHLQINARFIPLMASDLIRGQTIRLGVENGTAMADILLQGAKETPSVAVSIPSTIAKIIAQDLMLGQHIRKRMH